MGLYKEGKLFKSYKSDKKTTVVLPEIFQEITSLYDITALYYAKGPGSFMAIKVSYVFLKSFAIAKNITLKAVDGFYFNNNAPIKALGKTYFVKEGNNITFGTMSLKKNGEFYLPKSLNHQDFSDEILPLYILPAV